MIQKRILIIAAVLVGITLAIVFINIFRGNEGSEIVNIKNLSGCSKNIHQLAENNVFEKTYGLVKSANEYNQKKTDDYYSGSVRKGTCKEVKISKVEDTSDKIREVITTSIVVDIPEAEQSWQISYDWVKKGGDVNLDLGSITPECLLKEDLVYGNFQCDKILSLANYGTDKYDPILKFMPYEGQGFNLEFDPKNKEVTAVINVPPKQINNTELINNSKQAVSYWFEFRKLNINNYKVIYQVVPD